MKDWKVSAIRAAIAAEGNDGARQHFGRELAKAETVIDAAVKDGIYVIVDWHAHHAFPDQAQAFLTAIARRYGKLPNLIYEDWNEPLRDGVAWSRDVKPYHLQVIGAIRAIDPDSLVVAGSPSWSQDVDEAARDPLPFSNVAYTLHYYAGTHKQALRDKANAALAGGLALFVTEFGVVNADGNGPIDLPESEKWWAWDEAHHISWLDWSTGDKDESSATLKAGHAALALERGRFDRKRETAARALTGGCGGGRPVRVQSGHSKDSTRREPTIQTGWGDPSMIACLRSRTI